MVKENKKMIGIVGGMGPYAGIDLIKKIFDLTITKKDQDHVPITMISTPHRIPDRTKFIKGEIKKNPAIEISKIIKKLSNQGASIIGMPCNTAHSPIIINEILARLPKNIEFIHMIKEVVNFINNNYKKKSKIGIIATSGTIKAKLYNNELIKNNLQPINISDENQINLIDSAIYDKNYGIKSISNPITNRALDNIIMAMDLLIKKKVEIIILGCTELPLAINMKSYQSIPLLDSTTILAKSLLKNVNN